MMQMEAVVGAVVAQAEEVAALPYYAMSQLP